MINIKIDKGFKKDLAWFGTCVGTAIGYFLIGKAKGYQNGYKASDEWHKVNTPEVQIKALEKAKMENEQAAKTATEAKLANINAYGHLKATKKQYQDEIRPEIEAEIRKELKDYISKADEEYENAKKILKEAEHENELTELRLELMKKYEKTKPDQVIFAAGSYDYGDAISAISSSTMSSYDKSNAIDNVEMERDSEYYKAIIGIAKSNMNSYDRYSTIRSL